MNYSEVLILVLLLFFWKSSWNLLKLLKFILFTCWNRFYHMWIFFFHFSIFLRTRIKTNEIRETKINESQFIFFGNESSTLFLPYSFLSYLSLHSSLSSSLTFSTTATTAPPRPQQANNRSTNPNPISPNFSTLTPISNLNRSFSHFSVKQTLIPKLIEAQYIWENWEYVSEKERGRGGREPPPSLGPQSSAATATACATAILLSPPMITVPTNKTQSRFDWRISASGNQVAQGEGDGSIVTGVLREKRINGFQRVWLGWTGFKGSTSQSGFRNRFLFGLKPVLNWLWSSF